MKRLRVLGVLLLGLFLPTFVNAASGSISVSGPSTAVVGNTITVSVKLSTGSSWQVDLNYDKSLLQLTSSSAEGGGTYMVNTTAANPSRSYTFKFKTLKSGNATVKIGSQYVVADDFSTVSMSAGSKSIKIQTQAELEASYSDDATLKSLSVEGYDITPSFDKKTYEYSLEVENDIEKVNVIANKSDGNARVSGAGEIQLSEGTNKVEIVVTAQKGNSLTYTLSITRKELNPINVVVDNKNYTIVRKTDDLPKYSGFSETTIEYNGEEIPALKSEVLNKTIVGVKDEDGNIYTYIYNNGKFEDRYIEFNSNSLNIYIMDTDEMPYSNFTKTTIKINDFDVFAFKYKELNKYYLVYGIDITTGKENYFLYDVSNNTFQVFDDELFNEISNDNNLYLYVIIISLCVLLISIILNIILLKKKSSNKKEKKQKDVDELIKESTILDDDFKMIDEITKDNKKEKKKKNKKEE